MTTFTPLVDAEKLTIGLLRTTFPSPTYRVVTELPADLGAAPTIQVSRIGGSSQQITMDAANVDIDYYDDAHDGLSAYENTSAGAAQVRTLLLFHSQGFTSAGGAVQSVAEISAPRWVPYDNSSLRRFSATYRVTIHSIPA